MAIVPGRLADYDGTHPDAALLIVEVADTSLAQDRLTKTAIYAAAGVPECWIVDVRGQRVEVHQPSSSAAFSTSRSAAASSASRRPGSVSAAAHAR